MAYASFPFREMVSAASARNERATPSVGRHATPVFIAFLSVFGHWNFLSSFGTRFAYGNSVVNPQSRDEQAMNSETMGLNPVRCLELRKLMHELSNVTTGILISSGLLAQLLAGDERRRYCEQINEAGERTAVLVREAHALLNPEEQVLASRSAT
jgi:signal transduction histidine kinase